jgi:hypothetical protein
VNYLCCHLSSPSMCDYFYHEQTII